MKRIITVLSLLAALFVSVDLLAQNRVYCEIVGSEKFMSKKVTIRVDFGQESGFFSDQRLVDENGKAKVFNSMVDAMNFMGTLGWEFEQAYVVTVGGGNSSQNVYHWLLSKNVFDDETGGAGLKTKDDFNREQNEASESVPDSLSAE